MSRTGKTIHVVIKAQCIKVFLSSISSFENSVDPDQLASNEAS